MRIAIIGVGEVGRCFAEPLQASGAELLLCEQKSSEATLALATAWKLRPPGARRVAALGRLAP